MTRHLATCFVLIVLSLGTPALAAADTVASVGAIYDTVDAIEASENRITVTGIIAGQSAPSTLVYIIRDFGSSTVAASRCDRLALLAMSKPGKFQFATVLVGDPFFSCKLIVRTP